MATVNKIDANYTALAYAEEAVLGSLPGENGNAGTPAWKRVNPNSYSDFGGDIKTVSPNPINPSRQRKKGVAVDIDATGGFNHNLSFYNMTDLMQGALFANIRKKGQYPATIIATTDDSYNLVGHTIPAGALVYAVGFLNAANNGFKNVLSIATNKILVSQNLVDEGSPPATASVFYVGVQSAAGDVDVVNSGSAFPYLTSTILNFTTLGLVPGQWIYLGGDSAPTQFTNAVNNGYKRIRTIAANTMTFDKSSSTMVTEANTTKTVQIFFGDVLKNETGSLIVQRSYNFERTLGAPIVGSGTLQSEVLIGAVINEMTFNIPQADLVNVDLKLMAIDNAQRTTTDTPKQTGVTNPYPADIFNSTSDISRIRMHVLSDTDAFPTGLFAFLTDASVTMTNNLTIDKAIGVFGGFDVTAGTFEVSGSVTAYFSTVQAVQAIRNSNNVTIDAIFARDNRGIVLDLPLVALGDGRLKVDQDKPITMPLKMDAATSVDIDPNLDYTLMLTIFNYLPTVAC